MEKINARFPLKHPPRVILACAFVTLCIVVVSIFFIHSTTKEISRISVDLDGDDKPEVITLSGTSPESPGLGEWGEYSVRVSGATHKGNFFSSEPVIPIEKEVTISIVQIDRSSPLKQILIRTMQPNWNKFELLAFIHGELVPLLDIGSLSEPKIVGNGYVEAGNWEGFWERFDRYKLREGATKLILAPAATQIPPPVATPNSPT
jgi:hypothetical protein